MRKVITNSGKTWWLGQDLIAIFLKNRFAPRCDDRF